MEKLSKLVDRLLDRTEAGSLEWEATASDQAFQVSLTDSTVRISEEDATAEIGVIDYHIQIINGLGQVIETFSDRSLDKRLNSITEHSTKMGKIFELARRQALGVDDAIDSLLDELEEPKPEERR